MGRGRRGIEPAKIVKLFSPSKIHQALGGALFTVSAVLNLRVGHETLCTHWVLLLCIWMHARAISLSGLDPNRFTAPTNPRKPSRSATIERENLPGEKPARKRAKAVIPFAVRAAPCLDCSYEVVSRLLRLSGKRALRIRLAPTQLAAA